MRSRTPIRTQHLHRRIRLMLAACVLWPIAAYAQTTPQSSSPIVLDRVVAVVNNQAILSSDVDDEMRLSILEQRAAARAKETPQDALQRIISRTLIQQQMREQDSQASQPTDEQVTARIATIRNELPACILANCATDAGWKDFLASHGLTQQRVEKYLRNRLAILHFIELRFRPAISIPRSEIDTYYKDTLLPQYPKDQAIPPLEQVEPRIREILLQQHVNILFSDWLDNLRKEGDVEVLDPSLETDAAPAPTPAGAQ